MLSVDATLALWHTSKMSLQLEGSPPIYIMRLLRVCSPSTRSNMHKGHIRNYMSLSEYYITRHMHRKFMLCCVFGGEVREVIMYTHTHTLYLFKRKRLVKVTLNISHSINSPNPLKIPSISPFYICTYALNMRGDCSIFDVYRVLLLWGARFRFIKLSFIFHGN